MALDTAGVVGAWVVANYVPAYIYEANINNHGQGNKCIGNACFAGSFWFVAATTLT